MRIRNENDRLKRTPIYNDQTLASTPRGRTAAIAFAAPKVAAAPPMSNFMSSIIEPGPVFRL